jgi:LysR family transcriptional regulator, glycine cleavage system transcriptional activator
MAPSALSRCALPDLAAGRLVMPFAVTVPTPFAYDLVCPQATAERPKVAPFRRWLRAEAERDAAAAPA